MLVVGEVAVGAVPVDEGWLFWFEDVAGLDVADVDGVGAGRVAAVDGAVEPC